MVDVAPLEAPIEVGDSHVFLGSCFARNVGERFGEYGLDVCVNPLGTLYNPQSILSVVSHALQPCISSLPVHAENGVYRCWLADTTVEASTEDELRQQVYGLLVDLGERLRRARCLFVTLGTNVCYHHQELRMVVSNCHHASPQLFEESRLSVADCTAVLSRLLELLCRQGVDAQVVFTVSPYRYAKYGFHQSQLSKACLLLAVDEVCSRWSGRCAYFPSYELLLDDLRDYRFYDADMLHPSAVAVDYIWQRLTESYFSPAARQYLAEYEPIRKGLLHRPLHPQSEAYTRFIEQLHRRSETLRARYVPSLP